MKNIIKTGAYSLIAMSSVTFSNVLAAPDYNTQWAEALGGANANAWNIWTTIVNIMSYILWFLALIGVIFAIYAWFQILTAGWDDDKVKKGKTNRI